MHIVLRHLYNYYICFSETPYIVKSCTKNIKALGEITLQNDQPNLGKLILHD